MITSTVENYLKALYLQQQGTEDRVSTGALAESLSVTPGSATAMIKALAEAGLVEHTSHRGARLTAKGSNLAVHVIRRHRIIELFLVEILGLDWSEVHDEAEQLEHVISDAVLARMDEMLGHPTADPHGDPIPTARGTLPHRRVRRLSDCASGDQIAVERIGDQDPKFLRFVEASGLRPGAVVEVIDRDEDADAMTLTCDGENVVLALAAAGRIEVGNHH